MGSFKLSLKGDGITVEKEVDHLTAMTIMNAVLSQSGDSHSSDSEISKSHSPELLTHSPIPVSDTKPISLREYMNDKQPKTNAELIVTIAQFLALQKGVQKFTREDIKSNFSAAGEALPKNYSRDFQSAIDKGWIGEHHEERNSFFVTRTGETAFSQGFTRKK